MVVIALKLYGDFVPRDVKQPIKSREKLWVGYN